MDARETAPSSMILPTGGVLVTYGPYVRGGAHTSQSNEAFDASLRARNPLWGVRDIDNVAEAAGTEGLVLQEAVPMPANNFTLVWRKSNGAFPGARAASPPKLTATNGGNRPGP